MCASFPVLIVAYAALGLGGMMAFTSRRGERFRRPYAAVLSVASFAFAAAAIICLQ